MAKIGGGGTSSNLGSNQTGSNAENSPWEKLGLEIVDSNADRWFENLDPTPVSECYKAELSGKMETYGILSHVARDDLGIVPSFEAKEEDRGEIQNIPDSQFGRAILSYIRAASISMEYKTLWPISHEEQVELDVKHRLDGQWGTDRETPFIQSLEIYKDASGKLTAYWFVDLLATPVPLETYNEFEIEEESGEVSTYSFPLENGGWTVGQLSTKLNIPCFIKRLAYMSETPFPSTQIMSFSRNMAFKDAPENAWPKPFFTIRKQGLVQGYSRTLSKGIGNRVMYDGSLFPETLQFGWRFDEESIAHLAEILPVVIDGCSYAMSTVEDGFEDFRAIDYPFPWDSVLGSPCSNLVGYYDRKGSRLGAPQWIPNTHIGEIVSESREIYAAALEAQKHGQMDDAKASLHDLANDGAGPYFVHGINTMIYSHALPKLKDYPEKINEIEYFANQAIALEMGDQSTNAMCNLGIAYYVVGDLEKSAETLEEALKRNDHYSEAEASYFLSLVEEARGNFDAADSYRRRCEAAGGNEPPDWLFGSSDSSKFDSVATDAGAGMAAFCGNCGNKYALDNQKFCSNCGAKRL